MLTRLIIGSTLDERLKHIQKYRQKFQSVLDCNTPEDQTIEAVRNFQRSTNISSPEQIFHLIIEAQNLSTPAQQALLKTLEEPPVNTGFVITASKSSDLLPTILSRCQATHLSQKFELKSEDDQAAKDILRQISQNHAKLISLAEKLNKDQDLLKSLLIVLQSSLHSSPTSKRAKAASLVSQALIDLDSNIQSQLAIEHMLFCLKKLT